MRDFPHIPTLFPLDITVLREDLGLYLMQFQRLLGILQFFLEINF